MKMKLTVKLLGFMLLMGFMPSATSAQTWTGNTPEAGTFYLYNVGKEAFLGGAYDWGTHASTTKQNGISVNLEQTGDMLFKIATSPTYPGLYFGNV